MVASSDAKAISHTLNHRRIIVADARANDTARGYSRQASIEISVDVLSLSYVRATCTMIPQRALAHILPAWRPISYPP